MNARPVRMNIQGGNTEAELHEMAVGRPIPGPTVAKARLGLPQRGKIRT